MIIIVDSATGRDRSRSADGAAALAQRRAVDDVGVREMRDQKDKNFVVFLILYTFFALLYVPAFV